MGDNQKRSFARDALGHSSYFPCEYCFSKGVPVCIRGINENVRKRNLEIELQLINEKLQNTNSDSEKLELNRLKKTLQTQNKQLSQKKQ